MKLYFIFSFILVLAGCLSLYLAAPHQCWLTMAWPARPARLIGIALLFLSLIMLGQTLQGIAAVFTIVVWVMLVSTALPYLGVLISIWRSQL